MNSASTSPNRAQVESPQREPAESVTVQPPIPLKSEPPVVAYLAKKPLRKGRSHIVPAIWKTIKALWFQLVSTFSTFDQSPTPPKNLTGESPAGTFVAEQLPLCQALFDEQERRQERLEGKAQVVQAVISLLAPLMLGVIVFILTLESDAGQSMRYLIVACAFVSLLCLFVSLAASLRAGAVRNSQSLHLESVVNTSVHTVEQYTVDRHARGLLWCGTMNTAMNDLVADFVKAAQNFLFLGVIAGSLAGVFAGTMLTPSGDEREAALLQRLDRIEAALESIRGELNQQTSTQAHITEVEAQIKSLQNDVADIKSTLRSAEQAKSARRRK